MAEVFPQAHLEEGGRRPGRGADAPVGVEKIVLLRRGGPAFASKKLMASRIRRSKSREGTGPRSNQAAFSHYVLLTKSSLFLT